MFIGGFKPEEAWLLSVMWPWERIWLADRDYELKKKLTKKC